MIRIRKALAITLSVLMVLSVVPNSLPVYAAEADTSIEETQDQAEEEVIDEEGSETSEVGIPTDEETTEAVTEEITEEVTEETTEAVVAEETTEAVTEESTEEATTEEVVEEVTEEVPTEPVPTFNVTYEGVNVSGKDFSSCELLIATENPSIFTYDTEVVSEYNGIYLTRYPDATQTMNAYTYYFTKAPLVEVNTNNFKGADEEGNEQAEEESSDDGDVPQPEEVIEPSSEEVAEEVAEEVPTEPVEEIPNDGHGEADLSNLNNGDDAFSTVNDLGAGGYSGYIALIDTGANGADASVSVLGGGAGDDNGHGSRMASKIREMNPNAKILSIKALDSSNRGQASDIYAAINYAIDSNVSIINLSLTSLNTADCELVVSAIQQAINRGIVVVGAAGNYGSNASYFVPGCVSGAVICTATDENGIRLSNANFGSTVDYYVVAGSTSEAAATVSGLISRDGLGFSSEIVRTEEGVVATDTDATETDASETDAEESKGRSDNIDKQHELDDKVLRDNPWLNHGEFLGQLNQWQEAWDLVNRPGGPAPVWSTTLNEYLAKYGLPGLFDATFKFTQMNGDQTAFWGTTDGLSNISNATAEKAYNYTSPASIAVFCNCSGRGHQDRGCADPGSAGSSWSVDSTFYAYKVEDECVYYVCRPSCVPGEHHIGSGIAPEGYQEIGYVVRLQLPVDKNGALQILKVDQNNQPLGGATFSVTGPNGYSKTVTTSTDSKRLGLATLTGLADGTYTVKETAAPSSDYLVDSTPYNVNINTNYGYADIYKNYSYVFDGQYYYNHNSLPGYTVNNAYSHWVNYGIDEGRTATTAAFNWQSYVAQNGDLAGMSAREAFNHYVDYGANENRKTLTNAQYAAIAAGTVTGSGTGLAVVKVKDEFAKACIQVIKKSNDANITGLAGAQFKVFDTQAKAQAALTSKNYNQAIGTLTVSNPENTTGKTNILDVSNYMNGATEKKFYIVESIAPPKFIAKTTITEITAKVGRGETNPITVNVNEQVQVALALKKVSANPSCTDGNPNYELKDAVYRIFKYRADAVEAMATGDWSKALVNPTTGAPINLRTIADGTSNKVNMTEFMDKNADGSIKNTQFFLAEYRAPKNFKMNNVPKAVNVSLDDDIDHPEVAEVSDTPVDDPVDIAVVKQFEDHTEPLQGAEFTVKFYAKNIENNYTFAQLDAMDEDWSKTFTSDSNGKIEIKYRDSDYFPLGYITIEETKAPEGFKIDGSVTTINGTQVSNQMAIVFVSTGSASTGYSAGKEQYIINDDGTRGINITNAQVTNPIIVGDEEKSMDFKIDIKECGDDGKPISATFEIKNNDTNESYTFKTDDNGYYSSEATYVSHSAPNGIWFINGPQGIVRDVPDDTKRALTEGSYTVTEIDAAGHQKEEPITFDADEDGKVYTIYDDGRGDGLKIMSDMELPSIGTLALVELFADGSSLTDDEYEDIMKNFDGDESSLPDGVYKVLPATSGQKITDVCHYKNLRYNTDFTLYGRLMQIDKDGNVTPFVSNGKEVTGITHFHTPDTYEKSQYDSCGYETVRFEDLDFTGIQDTSFVVYESLYVGTLTEDDIASGNYDTTYVGLNNDTVEFPIDHHISTDKNQTVTTPTGQTQALSKDGTKTVSVMNKHFVIYDTCSYKGLIKGRTYEITGYVYEKPLNPKKKYTEDELKALRAKDKNGEYITGSTTFTAEKSEGSVVVKFEFDMDYKVRKKSYVVGEKCYDKDSGNVLVFTHEDISDHDQSFYEPVISTQAKGTEGRSELCYNEGKFIDTIHYENAEPNATYTVEGVAMDKETGKELILNGKTVKATATFTTGDSTNPNGSVDGDYDLEFTISEDQFEDLEGKTLVIFETLINSGGTKVAKHEDIEDEGQQLTVSKIRTTLVGEKTKTHIAYPDEQTTLIDTCKYENLIPGKSYSMNGVLMDKSTGEPLKDENGKQIESTTEFVADESGSGIVEVKFTFNAKLLMMEGKSVVCFEHCYPEGGKKPVGVHTNIEDKDQEVDFPLVRTKVSKSSWTSKDTISLTDSISYKNLMVEEGYKYIAKGWLVDQNGNKLVVDGKEVYKEVEFTPTSKDGIVDVKFDDFSAATLSGKYVVYEEVYVVVPEHKDENGKTIASSTALVGEHKDLSDSNQTITVSNSPKTGMTMFFVLMGLVLAAGMGMILTRRKETEDVE